MNTKSNDCNVAQECAGTEWERVMGEFVEVKTAELTKRDAAVCGGQKYLDAHWFERGALPPVGMEVEIESVFGLGWHVVVFIADVGDGDVVVMVDGEKHLHRAPSNFRPVRPKTEREVLIEIIKGTDDTDDRIADAILAARFKREGGV